MSNCSPKKLENDTLDANSYPAFNKEMQINIKGDSIPVYALIAKGEHKKETVILIKGYPGHDTNFDLAQDLRSNGYNVILFNHRGAWGSQGTYTYSNCLEDVDIIIDVLKEPKISKELKINPNKFILLGRSLGSGIALIQGSKINEVSKIIAISSVNYGHLMETHSTLSELTSYKKYMHKQVMMNHNIDEFLTELLVKKSEFNIVNYNSKLTEKEVLFIEDSAKNKEWLDKLTNVEISTLQSDHNFTNKRKRLISEIITWLDKDKS